MALNEQRMHRLTERLKIEGVKCTKQRLAVLEALANSVEPLTADDIFSLLKEQGIAVNLSTVYRTLDTLCAKDILVKSNLTDHNKAHYALNHPEHFHYLFCIGCNRLISVNDCPLEGYTKALQETMGFDVTSHKLEIYGYCRDCQRQDHDRCRSDR